MWKEQTSIPWELGSYAVVQDSSSFVIKPVTFPTLRCYLGETIFYDYTGKPTRTQLSRWYKNLLKKHGGQKTDVTLDILEKAISSHIFTVVGFPDIHVLQKIQDLLYQIADNSEIHLKTLVVHPHAPESKKLQDRLGVTVIPSIAVVEEGDSTLIKLFGPKECRENIEVYILSRTIPVTHFTLATFEELVLDPESINYVPFLIGFFAFWAPQVKSFLKFFQQTVDEFEAMGVSLRYGLVDVFSEKRVVYRHVTSDEAGYPPFIMLFQRDNVMKQINQTVVPTSRPSPYEVYLALKTAGFNIYNTAEETVIYEPYGLPEKGCELFEGPFGSKCSESYHNQTDNNPRERRRKQQKLKKKKNYHNQVWADVDNKLPKSDGIPLVSHATWSSVIEKSHVTGHLFGSSHKWAGEITKIAMVVFIIADCGSCRRSWNVFKDLHRAVTFIDGGSLYMANCSSDSRLCEEHNITGFPTVVVFRGLGWLDRDRCVSDTSRRQNSGYVRLDYHGVIQVKPIMEWFSTVSAPAVTDSKFDSPPKHMKEDARLTAVLLPDMSNYLPRFPRRRPQDYYSYQCYRLACELLFGQVQCYSMYSQNVPRSEFEDEDLNMVVIEILLERRDGMHVVLMSVGRSLMSTISEETGSHLDRFHKPHRYRLRANQKCEDDHAACTDLVTTFTSDHIRLPVTHLTTASFHSRNNPLLTDNQPVLIALVYPDNITDESPFLQTLNEVAEALYKELVVVTVNVDLYSDWASRFVPQGYQKEAAVETSVPELFQYPRLCFVQPADHHHAAFYPALGRKKHTKNLFTKDNILLFASMFLDNPANYLVQTEHF
ncbi:uncharacterized protein LOC121374493 [Gigantopelta aegis]|uniref:uncharacterized protein LOC121374493 n=1 Tax=Gigantopelta aegis TaxID=1735272 RepID=UPI001B889BD5|nr:uncharacterized protein LOC121374493 [Gigantopelta aegis]